MSNQDIIKPLNWVKTESKFTYSGKMITRIKLTVDTILGEIVVYESVNGKVYYHFLGNLSVKKNGIIHKTFEQENKVLVDSLEEGISICETKWSKVKKIINSI
jgi:hypothetical protein